MVSWRLFEAFGNLLASARSFLSTLRVAALPTALVDRLKALDPNRPIREADIAPFADPCLLFGRA